MGARGRRPAVIEDWRTDDWWGRWVIALFRSDPITITAVRRRAILRSTLWTWLTLMFLVMLLIFAVGPSLAEYKSRYWSDILSTIGWLNVWRIFPVFVVIWPIANVALRHGYAGPATAIFSGAVFGVVISLIAAWPDLWPLLSMFGAFTGSPLGCVYWLAGANTQDPPQKLTKS